MLVLFETPAGYAVFKLLDEKKLQKTENLFQDFATAEGASKVVKLQKFHKFEDTTEALAAATATVEGKMSKSLKQLLKKVVGKGIHEELAVADAKLGNIIKDKYELQCVSTSAVQELMRCIRSQINSLITGLPNKEITAMALGLAHSLSRYKLKFSPDKVDTMIVQAVSLLDDLDKELNNYVMRCREWYGWHFPEMEKIVTDQLSYVKTVQLMGMRTNAATTDFSDLLPEEVEEQLKEAAEISMGTEVSEEDMLNIRHLCDQVVDIIQYRSELYEYLKNRMLAIAPNLTVLVGELVGARLISHAGSLLNLAKHPASTVQILGAEKALFRALKTKKDTPKYGLIYHAQLVGQTHQKLKGKMSRMLAAKAALACRVDALGEETNSSLGVEHRANLERRLKLLEEMSQRRISGAGKMMSKFEKYQSGSQVRQYPTKFDSSLPDGKKRKFQVEGSDEPHPKKVKVEVEESASAMEGVTVKEEPITPTEKKKKKRKQQTITEESSNATGAPVEADQSLTEGPPSEKKKKKKRVSGEVTEDIAVKEEPVTPTEKKKKKKKVKEEPDV